MATILNNKVNINVLNVTDPTYGAVGDGTTDDTAAIQAAINAAHAGSVKTVYFPTTSAYYRCDGVLDLKSTWNLCLMGNVDSTRSDNQSAAYTPEICYTGTASVFMDIAHSFGLTIEGLGITNSNVAFTGDLINSDFTSGSTATVSFRAHDSYFGGHTSGTPNARSCIHLPSAVIAHIDRCNFRYADYGIIGRIASDTVAFSTEVTISRNSFDFLNHYGVVPTAGIQWNILNNIFEQSVSQKPAGISNGVLGGGSNLNGIKIIGNGFWDATVAGTYIDLLAYGAYIAGNYFDLRSTNTAVTFSNGGVGNTVIGNSAFGSAGATFLDFATVPSVLFTESGNYVDAGITMVGTPSNVSYGNQSFLTTTTGGARFLGYTTSASTPTTTQLPNSKDFCLHFDSGGSAMYLAYNLSGVIKKVALT